jgi:hypothetical protein
MVNICHFVNNLAHLLLCLLGPMQDFSAACKNLINLENTKYCFRWKNKIIFNNFSV